MKKLVFLLQMVSLSFLCFGSNGVIPISSLLDANGNLDLYSGRAGSVDLTGFAAEFDKGNGLAFKAEASPVFVANNWSPLGSGLSGTCMAVAVDGMGNVYAGGDFITAGGVTVNRIAKWNGSSWSALGSGVNATVGALLIDNNGHLIVGGDFTMAGGMTANRIARWNGSSWSTLGIGFNNGCWALAKMPNGDIIAGGGFDFAGGNTVTFIARWNGFSWSALGNGLGPFYCFALAIDSQGNIYAGGGFTSASGNQNCKYIAKWNGSAWINLGTGFNDTCNALAVDQNDNLYAGGRFTLAGGVAVNRAAVWNGTSWAPLGSGLSDFSHSMIVDSENNLIAGGRFNQAGGQPAGFMAKWNGSSWSQIEGGVNFVVQSIVADPSGNLFVGGWFSQAGGMAASRIAKYTSPVVLYTFYQDSDGDGFGNPNVTTQAPFPPFGYVADDNDCDDTEPSVNPASTEICDGLDNDCDGLTDEGFDFDNDGVADCFDNCPYTSNSGQEDSDCDGKGDVCDYCNGGDDNMDNNNDGYPDCEFYPGFAALSNAWKCSNNTRVNLCYVRTSTDISTICIHPNMVQTYLLTRPLSYVGPCNTASCNQAKSAGVKNSNNGLHLFDPFQVVNDYNFGNLEILLDESLLGKTVNFSLFDVLGRPVWQVKLEHLDASSILLNPIDFSLTNGMYFLSMESEGVFLTKPVTVQKQ